MQLHVFIVAEDDEELFSFHIMYPNHKLCLNLYLNLNLNLHNDVFVDADNKFLFIIILYFSIHLHTINESTYALVCVLCVVQMKCKILFK